MEEEDIDILKDMVEYATFELSLDGAIEDILREEMLHILTGKRNLMK